MLMKSTLEKRSEIHLGDLIEALSQLPWQNEQQAEKIARSLGFAPQDLLIEQHQTQKSRSAHQPQAASSSHTGKKISEADPPMSIPRQPSTPVFLPNATISGPLQRKADLPPPIVELARPSADDPFVHYDSHQYSPAPHHPLFPENTNRGIFTALLQTSRNSHRIDLARLLRLSARGMPPSHLPLDREGTLQYGCQLLLDFGETMAPWKNDLHSITVQIETVVGKQSVTTYRFKDEPNKAAHRTRPAEPKPWAPESRVPVLVATDFGLPLIQSEFRIQKLWKDFIRRCEQSSSPLIFVIPWEWPLESWLGKALGPYPYLFPWSPNLSSSQIKGLVGKGHNTGT